MHSFVSFHSPFPLSASLSLLSLLFSFIPSLLTHTLLYIHAHTQTHTHTNTHTHTHTHTNLTAYGYGFLMVLAISLLSLVAVAIVPFLNKNSKFGQFYKFLYPLLISMGVSALVCDAILHLIPHVRRHVLHMYELAIAMLRTCM